MDAAEGFGIFFIQINVLCRKELPVCCEYESHCRSTEHFRHAWWWSLRAKMQLEMMHKAESGCKNVCNYINIHKQLQRRQDRYMVLCWNGSSCLSWVPLDVRPSSKAVSMWACFCARSTSPHPVEPSCMKPSNIPPSKINRTIKKQHTDRVPLRTFT